MTEREPMSRRQALRRLGALSLGGVLAAGLTLLVRQPGECRDLCQSCGLMSRCDLPRALTARTDRGRPPQKSEVSDG